jgi:MFS family permease
MKKAINDIFSARFLTLSILPFFLILALSVGILIPASESFFELVSDPNLAQNEELPSFVTFIIGFSIIQWFLTAFAVIIGGGVAILFSFMLAAVFAGFMTPYIVSVIVKKHYPNVIVDGMSVGDMVGIYIGVVMKFILYFVIALFALLIPFIGLVALYLPFYYLFYQLLIIDVGGTIDSKEIMQKMEEKYKKEFRITVFIFFIVSNIPFVGIFLQVPFVIILTHQYLSYKYADISDNTNI